MDGGDFLSYIWRGAVTWITFGCIVLILLTESNFGIFTSDGDVGGSYWIPWTAGSFSEIFFLWEGSAPFGNRDVCDLLQPVGQILSSESNLRRPSGGAHLVFIAFSPFYDPLVLQAELSREPLNRYGPQSSGGVPT